MESIVNAIAKLSDGICCLNYYISRGGEQHFNETYQDVNDYYSYFNAGTGPISEDALERSLFTLRDCGGERIELSRNNKLFGSPVSLRSYVRKSNGCVNQRIFERLELHQSNHSLGAGCRPAEQAPPNCYRETGGAAGSFAIPK